MNVATPGLPKPPALPAEPPPSEFQETSTVKFEWTLRGLKALFDGSKGEVKSKATKSARFDNGRWQILFYANAGTANADGQTFVSLYLACEPTLEEKENAVNGKWSREGLFNFSFEIRNLPKSMVFGVKEAHDHSFHYPGAQNWGWAQFARRDMVYYQSNPVRQNDALVIICTITSSPAPPAAVPAIPRHQVPKDLLDAMGGLLDDPAYSDIEFILPRRGHGINRKIYAARRLLRRVDYFDTMFRSGFTEASADLGAADTHGGGNIRDDISVSSMGTSYTSMFDDSDLEDDDDMAILESDPDPDFSVGDPDPDGHVSMVPEPSPVQPTTAEWAATTTAATEDARMEQEAPRETEADEGEGRNTRPKLSHPSTPRSREMALEPPPLTLPPHTPPGPQAPRVAPPAEPSAHKKARIVMRDCAYATFFAVLYYIYTDTIVFAPLSSSFMASSTMPLPHGTSVATTPAALSSENQLSYAFGLRQNPPQPPEGGAATAPSTGLRSRKEWITEWERASPGRPRPPSAKSVFRLADKLDLQDLRDRAFQHIVKSLTVDNVAYEVFSTFSAAFEDVRKVQVRFFLDHWVDIRSSDAMRSVWQQIRLGRHPGFEEVWPAIAQHLEFKPPAPAGEKRDANASDY